MKTTTLLNKAIDYIMEHLEEEISIDDVAKHCNYSRFHFSRLFKQETGESIYAFITKKKMEKSAFRLKVDKDKSITTIGEKYGYSASNYSTIFKKYHKISPIKFRKSIINSLTYNPFYEKNNMNISINLNDFNTCNKNITIKKVDSFNIIYERYLDTYYNLVRRWDYFLDKYTEYISKDSMFIEQTYDDPSITDINSCLYDIGVSIKKPCSLENVKKIQGGEFAVYNFKGYSWNIYSAYQSIFNIWIPESDYVIDNRNSFDIYRFVNCETKYMEIDIHIPVSRKK